MSGKCDLLPCRRAILSLPSPFSKNTNLKKRFSEQQIDAILKVGEAGVPLKDICCKHNIADATFYTWRSTTVFVVWSMRDPSGGSKKSVQLARLRPGQYLHESWPGNEKAGMLVTRVCKIILADVADDNCNMDRRFDLRR